MHSQRAFRIYSDGVMPCTILDSKYFTLIPKMTLEATWGRGAIGTGHRTTSTSQRALSAPPPRTRLHILRPQFPGLLLGGQWVSQFLKWPKGHRVTLSIHSDENIRWYPGRGGGYQLRQSQQQAIPFLSIAFSLGDVYPSAGILPTSLQLPDS